MNSANGKDTHRQELAETYVKMLSSHDPDLPATRPVPVFAELRTSAGTIAIGAPATVGMLGAGAPVPGQNRSVLIELRVDDVDATWSESRASSPDRPRDRGSGRP